MIKSQRRHHYPDPFGFLFLYEEDTMSFFSGECHTDDINIFIIIFIIIIIIIIMGPPL
jgi:hypothetical protein